MKVQLTLRIDLKDQPDGYVGMTGQTWVIGKEDDLGLFDGVARLFQIVAPFYAECRDAEDLNADAARLAEWIAGVEFREVGP